MERNEEILVRADTSFAILQRYFEDAWATAEDVVIRTRVARVDRTNSLGTGVVSVAEPMVIAGDGAVVAPMGRVGIIIANLPGVDRVDGSVVIAQAADRTFPYANSI